MLSGSEFSDSESDAGHEFFLRPEALSNPPAVQQEVEEIRQAPVKKFGSFRVVNKRVKKVSLRTPLRPDHSYNAVSFNVTVKPSAGKWVFITGFEASGYLQEITIFKLVGKDVNHYIHKKNHWELIHRKWYPRSWNSVTMLSLEVPVRIGPGDTCGFYIHSNCETDLGLMYRSCAPGVVLEDSCIKVLHGWAHTSCIPFNLSRGWIRQHRVLSGNIFYEPTPIRWSPDRNFFWSTKTTFQLALDAVMTSSVFPSGILVEVVTFCGMDWFDLDYENLSLNGEDSDDASVKLVGCTEKPESKSGEVPQSNITGLVRRLSGVLNGFHDIFRSSSQSSTRSTQVASSTGPPASSGLPAPSSGLPVPRQADSDEKSQPHLEQKENQREDGLDDDVLGFFF